jgi:hypothetical protein
LFDASGASADNQINILTESRNEKKESKWEAIELIDVSKKARTQMDGTKSLEPARIPDREHNPQPT